MDGSAEASSSTEPQTPKQHYRLLKRRFKFLVYENECYQEELRNLQRKLLKLSRDKNFLLDRLLPHEKLSDSSDDSDICSAKAEEPKKPKRKPRPSASRKKPTTAANPDVTASSSPAPSNVSSSQPGGDGGGTSTRPISANGSIASNGGSDVANGLATFLAPDTKDRAS